MFDIWTELSRLSDKFELLIYEKIIIETEKMCQTIEKESNPEQSAELERETHKLRESVKRLIKKRMTRKIKSNLSPEEGNEKEKRTRMPKEYIKS